MFQLGGFGRASSCGTYFATRIDNIRSIMSYLRSLQITNHNCEVVVEWTTYEASRLLAFCAAIRTSVHSSPIDIVSEASNNPQLRNSSYNSQITFFKGNSSV